MFASGLVFIVKLLISYTKACAQRIHAFRMSYTIWVLLPDAIFGVIRYMYGVDYSGMALFENYTVG